MTYSEMTPHALQEAHQQVVTRYEAYKAMGLALNMSRGKPHANQLTCADGLLGLPSPGDCFAEDGTDCRNYGGLDGLPEMKRLFAEILAVPPAQVIVGGNSSLNIMFDCLSDCVRRGPGWQRDTLAFLCPVPGYDRHFAMCEYFNIKMLPIPMTPEGPDMDAVEDAVTDPAVVGMWCVPVFSNPQGYVYSSETLRRLTAMAPANPGFRLFWDNAYAVHHFRGARPQPLPIWQACESAGCPDRPLIFTSFSKISFGGAAVAAMAASPANLAFFRARLSVQTVGPDKMNQLRHVRFFKNLDGVLAHMEKLADILRPKFEKADQILTEELTPSGVGRWHCPDGGYFLSFDTPPGCAKRTAALCREAGVIITDAGATFPYGHDPKDQNLRLAPTYLNLAELETALRVFCTAAQLAALEKQWLSEVHARD